MVDEFKGEYWNKSQVAKGKELAKSQGYNKFKVKKGSYLGSYTLTGKKGWQNESERHRMARYGIKTGRKTLNKYLRRYNNPKIKKTKIADYLPYQMANEEERKKDPYLSKDSLVYGKSYKYPSHIDKIMDGREEYLDEVADDYNLTGQQRKALGGLFKDRFFTFSPSYVREWAERIRNGSAWAHSDSLTRAVLKKYGLGYEVSPSGTNDDVWKN